MTVITNKIVMETKNFTKLFTKVPFSVDKTYYTSLLITTTKMIKALNMNNKIMNICFQGFISSLSSSVRSPCTKQYKAAPTAHTSTVVVSQLLGLGSS